MAPPSLLSVRTAPFHRPARLGICTRINQCPSITYRRHRSSVGPSDIGASRASDGNSDGDKALSEALSQLRAADQRYLRIAHESIVEYVKATHAARDEIAKIPRQCDFGPGLPQYRLGVTATLCDAIVRSSDQVEVATAATREQLLHMMEEPYPDVRQARKERRRKSAVMSVEERRQRLEELREEEYEIIREIEGALGEAKAVCTNHNVQVARRADIRNNWDDLTEKTAA